MMGKYVGLFSVVSLNDENGMREDWMEDWGMEDGNGGCMVDFDCDIEDWWCVGELRGKKFFIVFIIIWWIMEGVVVDAGCVDCDFIFKD